MSICCTSTFVTSTSTIPNSTIQIRSDVDDRNNNVSRIFTYKLIIIGDSFVGKSSLLGRYCTNTFSNDTKSTIGAAYITKKITCVVPVPDNNGSLVNSTNTSLSASSNSTVSTITPPLSSSQSIPTTSTTPTSTTTNNNNTNKNLKVNITLRIWDTAGTEIFRSLTKSFFRETSLAIICYDITNHKSFETLKYWIDSYRENEPCSFIILGNKYDLIDNNNNNKRQVLYEEVEELIQKIYANDIQYFSSPGSGFYTSSLSTVASSVSSNKPMYLIPPRIFEVSAKTNYGVNEAFQYINEQLVKRSIILNPAAGKENSIDTI